MFLNSPDCTTESYIPALQQFLDFLPQVNLVLVYRFLQFPSWFRSRPTNVRHPSRGLFRTVSNRIWDAWRIPNSSEFGIRIRVRFLVCKFISSRRRCVWVSEVWRWLCKVILYWVANRIVLVEWLRWYNLIIFLFFFSYFLQVGTGGVIYNCIGSEINQLWL